MYRILVVDDEVMIRKLLTDALSGEGYETVTVPSREEAIGVLARERFDLVILDVRLGGESGLPVVRKMRESGSRVPAIVYTGALTAAIETEARSAGADEVLNKTIGIIPLLEQIKRFLSSSGRTPQDTLRKKDRPILVVDDEESIRKMLKAFLESKGYAAVTVESGEKALELVRGGLRPAAVLLDMQMPGGMDGLATLKQLLVLDPSLGVVVATGASANDNVRGALELGAYGYVLKPFDFLYLELVVLSRLLIA